MPGPNKTLQKQLVARNIDINPKLDDEKGWLPPERGLDDLTWRPPVPMLARAKQAADTPLMDYFKSPLLVKAQQQFSQDHPEMDSVGRFAESFTSPSQLLFSLLLGR